MEAFAAYRVLRESGVNLSARGGKLLAGPASCLDDDLRGLIRNNKVSLLVLLENARRTTDKLLEAGMRACEHHGDNEAAREEMRAACLRTPSHLRRDLLEYLCLNYGPRSAPARPAPRMGVARPPDCDGV